MLVERGEDINAQNYDLKSTPLHTAAEHGKRSHAKMLLDLKADTNLQKADGYTPLHVAAEGGFGSLAKMLVFS